MVGKVGFEPTAPCSQSRYASQTAPLPAVDQYRPCFALKNNLHIIAMCYGQVNQGFRHQGGSSTNRPSRPMDCATRGIKGSRQDCFSDF
jgi:hypothetical protein